MKTKTKQAVVSSCVAAGFSELRRAADITKVKEPELWKLVCPRRYVPPQGYVNPEIQAELTAAQIAASQWFDKTDWNKTMVDTTLAKWKLIECDTPTFFVGDDFITELAWTDPPQDMKFGELLWPHDGMLFVLPESFQRRFFSRPVPFITMAKQKTGLQAQPECIKKIVFQRFPIGIVDEVDTECVIVNGMVMVGDKPVDYSGSWPMRTTIGDALSAKEFADDSEHEPRYTDPAIRPTHEEDLHIINRIAALGVILVLGMMAAPEYIERDSRYIRPAKINKQGEQEKEALWHPNFLGFKYRSNHESLGGTHAGPRPHYRRGHMHRFRHGKAKTLIKVQWVKRTAINYPKKENENVHSEGIQTAGTAAAKSNDSRRVDAGTKGTGTAQPSPRLLPESCPVGESRKVGTVEGRLCVDESNADGTGKPGLSREDGLRECASGGPGNGGSGI